LAGSTGFGCGANIVMSKTAPWNGTLPSSGFFYVTLDVPRNVHDRHSYTFSMTVSII